MQIRTDIAARAVERVPSQTDDRDDRERNEMSEISEEPQPTEADRRCRRSRRRSRRSTSTRPWSGSSWARRTTSPRCSRPGTALQDAGIRYEVRVMSAHRDPELVREYCHNARMRGLKVIIAGAGMSAALPGVAAAHTDLPVIGVPILGKSLGGLDALLSAVQMPPGHPGRLRRDRRGQERRRARGADHQRVIPRYTRPEIGGRLDPAARRWSAGSRSSWRRPRPGPRRASCRARPPRRRAPTPPSRSRRSTSASG